MAITSRPPDLEAEITFLSTADGGRRSYVTSGYRPSHDFGILGTLNDGVHEYVGAGRVEPGGSALAKVWLLAPEYQKGRLCIGFRFSVQEGPRIVGHGVIHRVLNEQLQASGGT